jgi:hypothetical protein
MAWIVERRGGFLVRWRDAERKTRSKFVHTPEEAEELRAKVEAQARARRVLSGVEGIPGWESERVVGEAAEPEYAFETYLRAAIENDRNLRETTREMYLIGVRNHIEKTPLGKADIRGIQPDDVQRFWDGLEIGNGALRNVQQLLSKGSTGRSGAALSTSRRSGGPTSGGRRSASGPTWFLSPWPR